MKEIALTMLLAIPFIASGQDNEFRLDETYPIDRSGYIELSSDDAKVFITGTDRSDVHVKIDRVVQAKGLRWGDKAFDVIIEVRNGNLYIKEQEYDHISVSIGYQREEYVIKIEAPKSVGLVVKGDDDDYLVRNMNGDLKFDIDDGDLTVSGSDARRITLSMDDGDFILENSIADLTVDIDDGDLTVRNSRLQSIDIRADDADVEVTTSLHDNGDYRFRIEDGNLELEILSGGGRFDIRYEGFLTYSGAFKAIEEDEDFALLQLPGGESRVRISGDDMRIRLRSLASN